ncbi:hypothetical protein WR25_27257 [Diploscapter pachys]|uniref:Lethal giant larvae homologue 2 domain-containing protein n=1 Tax=Diploscapter pachys TaxID=2018661 RepID=A0A2A2L8F6_9BILA|nr:hypothetical protein WR25_27257 [Diploscapter pachys]
MDKAKKKFASAIDGIRQHYNKTDISVEEKIQPEHCLFAKVCRHGYPDDARCMAYDPVQKLLAIGTGHGIVRMIGESGVDYLLKHEGEQAVNHVQFLVNEGGLITACSNDMIHLWNFRQKTPEVVHSLQLTKDSVTCIHLPISGKWLYVGTDKGNVYFVSLATFQMSSYVINWNKAIDLSCRIHPGAVKQLAVSPTDPLKLVIAYEKGVVVIWNITTKEVDRFPLDPPIKCVSWHYDGKKILTGNVDGSICVYNVKKTSEAEQRSTPHGTAPCRPITQIEWKHQSESEPFIIYSGGMPADDGLPVPALTVLRGGRSATVLELDYPIISFVPLSQIAYNSCPQQPHSIAVLLKGDLMVLDLQNPGFFNIESPHAMDIHESPVTTIAYYSDCPLDLIGALALVGTKQRKKDYSQRSWPINGGLGRDCATGHQELILTGHKDGTVRFWQASGENLQILYRLKTASHFERLEEFEGSDKVSHAVKNIQLCLDSRQLLIGGVSGQVTLFRFLKAESLNTIAVVNIPLLGSASTSYAPAQTPDDRSSNTKEEKQVKRQRKVMSRDSTHSPDTSDASGDERILPFKVRGAPVKRPPGYQPELACLIPWHSHHASDTLISMALNSAYGVIALGTVNGLALIDIAQCALIYAWTSAELYGSDPTPAIQLSNPQHSMECQSPGESPRCKTNGHAEAVIQEDRTITRDSSTSQSMKHYKSGGVVGIIRRNTAELASAIREKYQAHSGHSTPSNSAQNTPRDILTDRPDEFDEEEQEEERRPSQRTYSVKGAIVRRLTKKKELSRSRSFHSHISEEGETPRDSPRQTIAPLSTNLSASSHSLEVYNGSIAPGEAVTNLQFMNSSSKRNDPKTGPCLWVGTSSGAMLALNLLLPTDRINSTVVVAPSGTIVKMKGQILYAAFMDSQFCLLSPPAESYKETSKESKDGSSPDKSSSNKILTKASLAPHYAQSMDQSDEINQILICVAECEIKVIAMPSFSQLFIHKCEEIPLVKANATHIRGQPALMCLSAAGQMLAFSLVSLKPLLTAPMIPHSIDIDDLICQRMSLSEHGLGAYMTSPTEMEKFTVCAEVAEQTEESMGELFVPCEMPETPKNTSFLKGVSSIFASSPRPEAVDIDSILTDKDNATYGVSGMRSVARTFPGPSVSMDRAHAGGVSAGQAAVMALQNLAERTEKLSATVDATENLKNNALNLQSRTSKLVEKYEKKKWYQL